jgi:CcmD family protein
MTLSGYTQAAATDRPEARETGFHAVSPTPGVDGGATALVEAYAIIWVLLFGFVLLAWRKLGRIEARMGHLEQVLSNRDKTEAP